MNAKLLGSVFALSVLVSPAPAQDIPAPEFDRRILSCEFVLVAEVESVTAVGEEVDEEAEVIVKTYRAGVKTLSVLKGMVRSEKLEVEYTKRIGVRTPYPEVTLRKGLKYVFFLEGTGKAGVFRVYDPYFGATRVFTQTVEEAAEAARLTATMGRLPGVEPLPQRVVVPEDPDPEPEPKREEVREPGPEAPPAPGGEVVDGFRGHLGGPTMFFAAAGEARVWLVVENASDEVRALYAGDLGPFLRLELRSGDAGESRVAGARSVSGHEADLYTLLAPGEALYFPVDLGSLFDLRSGAYAIQAVLDLPSGFGTSKPSARAWSGRLTTVPVEVRIGEKGPEVARPPGDPSPFVRPGRCTEVHEATFEISSCARCGRTTSSRARAICQACARELGVCPFCLKKR